ncbi:lipopolysaccharide biosynthesis protein [Enterococcus casseliflavus]|uniref:Polysaccharide biosynthesis protein n=1 Tax=Enterococcus casseliflavus TaxID=37734 RepID=A0AAW8UUU1_ENTCA|nr:hypothetical protein [Enterococcus casseliflavus]MDT2966210.1 hypothetical protein [Enterococcus casseliflavus]
MKRKIFFDLTINIISNLILIAFIQIIIFPLLSRKMDAVLFGQIVSIYGFSNVITTFLGNTLNNIRLIDKDCNERKSDFANISLYINTLSFVLIFILSLIYGKNISLIGIILFSIGTLLTNNRLYCTVYYRKELKFSGILILNLMVAFGYLTGLILVQYFLFDWATIFISGELIGLIYLFSSKNNILLELRDINIFENNETLIKKFLSLSSSNVIANTLNYLDRFMILPILGATSMSVFYAASSISKILTMLITPMTNVLLSYIARSNYIYSKKKLLNIIVIIFVLLLPFYFIINFVSNYLVAFLYPTLAEDAYKILPILTVGILLNIISSILNPFLIKFYKMFYQNIIQLIYGIVYLVIAFYLSFNYGLYGFSIAFSCAMLFKLVIQIIITIFGKYNLE